jgi:hypothetical protein
MATITITVTVSNPGSGNKYYLDGVLQATYAATPGNTYKFDQSDGSNSGHPLRLSITSDGTHNSGSAYTTGVTTNGTPGSAGAYTQIEVTALTVQALYYYCTAHSGMGGSFNTGSSATVQFQDRKGFDIQNFSADQTSVGQIYYNSATGSFKAITDGGAPIGAWSSGGSTNTEAGQRGGASRSSTSDAFVSGGFNAGGPSVTTNAESYNGTAWTEGPNQPATNRIGASWGATNSYVTAGGSTGISGPPINPYAFEWNGSSFSNGGQLNSARRNAAGAGVSESAGRVFAGGDNPGPAQSLNESYNGTAFTEETDMNTARIRPIGFGTTTAAIAASGSGGTNVESWDGSSWTEVAEVVVAVSNSAGGGGTSTDGLIFTKNGTPPGAATCQFWNGTSFTEVADLSVNRYANVGGGANSTNCISVGGYGPPAAVATSTEEWTAAPIAVKTLTTS